MCSLSLLGSLYGAMPALAESPQRIVSLNVCADQLVLSLAGRDRLMAVSWLAADPRYAPLAALADQLPGLKGRLEEVVRLRPDMVITERWQQQKLSLALRRLGVPVLSIETPDSISGLYALIRQLAAQLGVPDRGARLIADMQIALQQATALPATNRRALMYLPLGGSSTALGTFGHDLFRLAGLRNVAVEEGLGEFEQVSLERLVMTRPDLLVFLQGSEDWPSRAEALLDHPVVQALADRVGRVDIPLPLWLCPGPWSADAVRLLREAAATP